jgi:hypothetical protein
LPKITGQFNESLSATPPPDVFWRVRSCILLPVGFSTSGREVPVPGTMRVERPFSRPVELGRQRASAAERDADVENEPVGISRWRDQWSSLKSGKIVTEAYKIHTP